MWNALSEDEKKVYKDKSDALKEKAGSGEKVNRLILCRGSLCHYIAFVEEEVYKEDQEDQEIKEGRKRGHRK